MEVLDIVREYLKANGFDGLASEDCGCPLDDLKPCCGEYGHCEPAYKEKCDGKCEWGCDPGDWHMTTVKPEVPDAQTQGGNMSEIQKLIETARSRATPDDIEWDLADVAEDYLKLKAEATDLKRQLAEARKRIARMEEGLDEWQWSGAARSCICCGRANSIGHAEGCYLALRIDKITKDLRSICDVALASGTEDQPNLKMTARAALPGGDDDAKD